MPKAIINPGLLRFSGSIEKTDGNGGGAFIPFPYNLKETFGIGNLVPVVVTFDGIPYKGSIANLGDGPILVIKKEIREKLGKQSGETVDVTVELDTSPRQVEVPTDLQALLKGENLEEYFNGLAYTHKKEYVRWIEEAKRPETRVRRLEQAIIMLKEKRMLS